MRHTFSVLSALCLAALASATAAEGAPQTVNDNVNIMNDVAGRLDIQNTSRQKAGDMAAAQRVGLTAAMIRRVAEEFRVAEQEYMTSDARELPAPVRARLKGAIATAQAAETRAADQPAFIDAAQRALNALIGALPIKTPHPIVYGLLSRDLSPGDLPSDVVIYGYGLVDPVYKINPVVLFGKTEIPAAVVHDDRIDVTLPDDVKKSVNFAPPPCDSRASFGLRVHSVFAERHGVWPLVWHTQAPTNADVYVLPTPVFYTAKALVSMDTGAQKPSLVPFDERSTLAMADCDQSSKAEVIVPLPANATDVTCAATWTDASGAKSLSSHCASEGGAVQADGEISAQAHVCSPEKLCSCPVAAQGFLEAKGSYQIPAPAGVVASESEAATLTFPAGGMALGRVRVPPGAKLGHVALSLTRRACPAEVDSIDLGVSDDPQGHALGVSKTGAFRAAMKGEALSVGAADAFDAVVDKSP